VPTHDEKVLSNLQGWLAGPVQACRLLAPLRASVATPGLLATLRAIARVVRWNLAALRGVVLPGLWPLPGLEDAAGFTAPARAGCSIQRRQPEPPTPFPATARAGWDVQRMERDAASRRSAESAAGTQPGRTPGQTPQRTRIPQQVEDSVLIQQTERTGVPDLSGESARVVAAGPGLGRDLALKTAIRVQLDAVLAGSGVFSGRPAMARRGVAPGPFSENAPWPPEVERRLDGQVVRHRGEPSFAPIAAGDAALVHGGLAGSPEPASDRPQQVGESGTRRIQRTGESSGGVPNLLGNIPLQVASGEIGNPKRAAESRSASRRRFTVQKRPASAEAAKGAKASESASTRPSEAPRRMRVELARAPTAFPLAPEIGQPARAASPPTSAQPEPGHKPRQETGRPSRAAFVQDGAVTALIRQAQATLAHMDAGLLAVAPLGWPAEAGMEEGQAHEPTPEGGAHGPPVARTIREIGHRLASTGGQAATSAVRRDQAEMLWPSAGGERQIPSGPLSEKALAKAVGELAGLVGQLQRQVQQLASATGQSLGGAAYPEQQPEGEGDPQALSRKLAEQLVREARRYGIRI
jgi:hypothetical protein